MAEGVLNKDAQVEEEVGIKMVEIPIEEDAAEAVKEEAEDEIQTLNPLGIIIMVKTGCKREAIHKKSGRICHTLNAIT
jgi:hypothetical protein